MRSPAEMKIIQVEITNACSRRCSNCTRLCGHQRCPFLMTFAEFKAAVDSLVDFPGIVGVMGGEPTLHPEFERFVAYLQSTIGAGPPAPCTRPSPDFLRYLTAHAMDWNYSNRCGLWSSVGPKYYQHFELIQDAFGYQMLNDHSNPGLHQTLLATRRELGIPDADWVRLRDACWVQNLWSASITPKGAFFCEVAAAMDMTLGGPGGWPVEPGWWKRQPSDFGKQLEWCEQCSACLPMPRRRANTEVDDVSPAWRRKLEAIGSPKLQRGLVNVLDPGSYDRNGHRVVTELIPYLGDGAAGHDGRLGLAREQLVPQRVTVVAWPPPTTSREDAARLISGLRAAGRLDAVLSNRPEAAALAERSGAAFVDATNRDGHALLAMLRQVTQADDWILLARGTVPSDRLFELLRSCVFNPGCLYWRRGIELFNVRAHALRAGGDLFRLARAYPRRKIIELTSLDPARYRLSNAEMFLARASKRLTWLHRRLRRLPTGRGPVGGWIDLLRVKPGRRNRSIGLNRAEGRRP